MPKTELIRIGGIWKQTSKTTGVTFLRGSVAKDEITLARGDKILIFWSKKKTTANSPDYNMFVEREIQGPPEDEDDFGAGAPPFDGADDPGPGDDDDKVPF